MDTAPPSMSKHSLTTLKVKATPPLTFSSASILHFTSATVLSNTFSLFSLFGASPVLFRVGSGLSLEAPPDPPSGLHLSLLGSSNFSSLIKSLLVEQTVHR